MSKHLESTICSRTYNEQQALLFARSRNLTHTAPHKFNSSRVFSWAKKLDKKKMSALTRAQEPLAPLQQRMSETLDIAIKGFNKL
jgi:hypothetical protein